MDEEDFKIYLTVHGIIFAIAAFIWFMANIDNIPGFDYLTTIMFVFTTVIFIIALKQKRDFTDLKYFRSKKKIPYFSGNIYYSDGIRPKFSIGSKTTWASLYTKEFAISFFDNDTKEQNIKEVHETVHRVPRIVWWSAKVWLISAFVCFFGSFIFYEAVIPNFENMVMTDEAFAFIDNFIFYLPASLALLCSVACLVLRIIQNNLLHECAKRLAKDNQAAEERRNTIGAIESVISKKWYYNVCPNCGSAPAATFKSCPYCGTSLEVTSVEGIDQRLMHRLPSTVYKMNSKAPVKRKKSDYHS